MGSPARSVTNIPRALTIAGSDSGGGAGIQADLKVFLVLGCHGMSAVTALTAQNTVAVSGVHEVPAEFVTAQIEAVANDIGVDAAKTGMLATASIIEAVAKSVEVSEIPRLVVDPVSISKHGDQLLVEDALDALKTRLLPLAEVVTPNLHEARALTGREIHDLAGMRDAARALIDLGPETALVKGGHLGDSGDDAVDVFFDGRSFHELRGPRYDTSDTHGTGCALAAAITARLARGDDVLEAVRFAKEFVARAIEHSLRLGGGYGPVNPGWTLLR